MTNSIEKEIEKLADDFGIDKKRSIGDVAEELGVETHVIRFWEENFSQINPVIGKKGRRYYYNKQLKVLKRIKKFLYEEGYTIAGLQKLLKKRKSDAYKEEDLDIIALGGDNLSNKNIENALEALSLEAEGDLYNLEKNVDDKVPQLLNEVPNTKFVANIVQVSNINKMVDNNSALTKEQREELSVLFKNITKNLGDLKMLLRS